MVVHDELTVKVLTLWFLGYPHPLLPTPPLLPGLPPLRTSSTKAPSAELPGQIHSCLQGQGVQPRRPLLTFDMISPTTNHKNNCLSQVATFELPSNLDGSTPGPLDPSPLSDWICGDFRRTAVLKPREQDG
ncbi:hypothetical protein NHX12_031396 [Muraenolepis orangiensis]|uniref:Uncharacterized protein n=1 Tax=Muraenolepis orangiensis TaxID=630683 RepID=A0A9Q0E3Z1_9TELE|nr:hypothetical protein NHX12_031396 [Muraenolepis orangiensis]